MVDNERTVSEMSDGARHVFTQLAADDEGRIECGWELDAYLDSWGVLIYCKGNRCQ